MTDRKVRIADAMNTYNRALTIIRQKGYGIYLYPDEHLGDYWAIKDQRDFIASDPLRLLGLISLWEHYGDNWQATRPEKIYDEILSIAFPDDDYASISDEAFLALLDYLKPFLTEILGIDMPRTRKELAHSMNTFHESDDES